jgi:HEAT repeat protein
MTDQSGEFDQLLAMLRTDDPPVDPEIIKHVVSELRRKDIGKIVPVLTPCLKDANPEFRCTIATVFLACDATTAIPHVGSLIHDEDDDVRGFLCMELGAYKRREAVPLLVDALLNDPDATNRTWAAWGLGNIGDPSALPTLKLAMQNDLGEDYEGRPVKEIAAEAIRRITQEKTTTSVA